MTARLLDGKIVATDIKQRLTQRISTHIEQGLPKPGLAVVLVGNDPASSIYVHRKQQACLEIGFYSEAYHLPHDVTEHTLLTLIDTLNEKQSIHGILVQLPLPAHIRTDCVIERIRPEKDVDGFHPYNLGRLAQNNPSSLRPCTPFGIMTLLKHYDINVAGKHAVIIGASNIVGRPMAFELLHAKATVTVCHRQTMHLEKHIRMADMIIIAAGTPDLVKSDWLHQKQIIIDVGIHRLSDGSIRGDVDFHAAKERVSWITPVPGGVGPLTICMLLQNTLNASQITHNHTTK